MTVTLAAKKRRELNQRYYGVPERGDGRYYTERRQLEALNTY